MDASIRDFVIDSIREFCDVGDVEITGQTNLVKDLSLDSIDFLDVVYAIDRKYKIKLPIQTWTAQVSSHQRSGEHFFVLDNFVLRIQEVIAESRSA